MKTLRKLFKNPLFNIVLILILTAFSLYFNLKDDYVEVIHQLKAARLSWFLCAIVAVILHRVLYGFIIMIQARSFYPKYTLFDGIKNTFIDAFASGITPAGTGGNISQIMTLRGAGLTLSDSVSLLWMDSIIYQFCLVAFTFIMILLRYNTFIQQSPLFSLVLVGFLINTIVLCGIWVVSLIPAVHKWISSRGVILAHKVHLIKDPEKTKALLEQQIDHFQQGVKILKQRRFMILELVILNLIRLLIYNSIVVWIALSLSIPLTAGNIIDILALSVFVTMMATLFPVPGSSGGIEPTFIFMFAYIFTDSYARTSMLLWRFTTYFFVLILGAIMLMIYRRKDH